MRAPMIMATTLLVPSAGFTGELEINHYQTASPGTRVLAAQDSDLQFKILVEAANLGGNEVEIAEVYVPPHFESSAHVHGLEIFYVLEGELHHIVNGELQILEPGMIGIVRAPDEVIHKVTDQGMRALIVWPGGGEVEGLARRYTQQPIGAIEPAPATNR